MPRPDHPAYARELEAKFRVNSLFEIPNLERAASVVASVDPPRQATMTAIYYDTPDLRLAREGVTLRRRAGGSDPGWHLKLPVDGATVPDGTGVRDEIQLPDAPELPDELRSLVTVWVRSAQLTTVATLVSERVTFVFRDSDGEKLAELVDDTVTVHDTNQVQARFRELEVEDLGGGPKLVGKVGALLRDAGAVGGEFVPKVVRALGPRATAPPEPPPARVVHAQESAHDLIVSDLCRHTRSLMAEDVRARRAQPDAVHQMRVAIRRLRSALDIFAPLLDDQWATSLRTELGWLGGVLGASRDAEVLRTRLLATAEALPIEAKPDDVRAKISELTAKDAASADTAVLEAIEGSRYVALIDRLVDAAMYPRTTEEASRSAAVALLPIVEKGWDRLARRAERVMATADDQADVVRDYHMTRIAAKRLRYTCDAVAGTFGDDAVELSKQGERIQEILGEHQDAVVAATYLAGVAAKARLGHIGFGLGIMFARQEAAADAARCEFAAAWPDVSRAKYRRWLANQ